MYENKQAIMDKLCEAIRLTAAGGNQWGNNALAELKYIPDREVVKPVFEDGAGADGYYEVNVACDSGIAMIMDVVNQFVKKMW